jgi:hypothetical protein
LARARSSAASIAAWYAAWIVPVAAAEDDGAAHLLALLLSGYLLSQAVPL